VINLKNKILENFSCQKSGNCCRAPGYVYVTAQDVSKMAAHLGVQEEDFRASYVQKVRGWEVIAAPNFRERCFLTAEDTCGIYDVRPLACRTYPQWEQIWESEESLQEELKQCSGLRRAAEIAKSS
jgi:uncharacterized protein